MWLVIAVCGAASAELFGVAISPGGAEPPGFVADACVACLARYEAMACSGGFACGALACSSCADTDCLPCLTEDPESRKPNAWNEFQKRNAGKYTRAEQKAAYGAEQPRRDEDRLEALALVRRHGEDARGQCHAACAGLDAETLQDRCDAAPSCAARAEPGDEHVPDAVNQLVEDHGLDRVDLPPILRHTKLGQFSVEEQRDVATQRELLMLLQRELHRIRHLKFLSDADFQKRFTVGYTNRQMVKDVGKAVVVTGISIGGMAGLGGVAAVLNTVASESQAYGSAVNYIVQYEQNLQEANARLLKKGPSSPLDFWRDVPMGMLYDCFHRVTLAKRNQVAKVKVVMKPIPILEFGVERGENETRGFTDVPGDLPAGTLLRKVSKHGFMGNPKMRQLEWLDPASGKVQKGMGFLAEGPDSIADQAWYMYGSPAKRAPFRDKGLPIVSRRGSVPDSGEAIQWHDYFTVVKKVVDFEPHRGERQEFWKLGDGRGWVRTDEKLEHIIGPLTTDELEAELAELEQALKPEAPEHETLRGVTAAQTVQQHPATVGTKVALHTGLFIGGFFTFGATWIANAAIGGADAVASASLAVSQAAMLRSVLGFAVAGLADFEQKLFKKQLDAAPCDIVKAAETNRAEGACGFGEVCLRSGVFARTQRFRRDGFCVPSVRPALPDGSFCVTDSDCQSGLCDQLAYVPRAVKDGSGMDPLQYALGGTCQEPCEPDLFAVEGRQLINPKSGEVEVALECYQLRGGDFGIRRTHERHRLAPPPPDPFDEPFFHPGFLGANFRDEDGHQVFFEDDEVEVRVDVAASGASAEHAEWPRGRVVSVVDVADEADPMDRRYTIDFHWPDLLPPGVEQHSEHVAEDMRQTFASGDLVVVDPDAGLGQEQEGTVLQMLPNNKYLVRLAGSEESVVTFKNRFLQRA